MQIESIRIRLSKRSDGSVAIEEPTDTGFFNTKTLLVIPPTQLRWFIDQLTKLESAE